MRKINAVTRIIYFTSDPPPELLAHIRERDWKVGGAQ
jgi:hypothetical protein